MRVRVVLTALLLIAVDVVAAQALPPPAPVSGQVVSFESRSPFGLVDAVDGDAPSSTAVGQLFLPADAAAGPVPAVVLLHGAGGVMAARELTYARQFAARGWAALVVDAFGSRLSPGTRFVERLLNVTEAMLLADAYAALAYLAADPRIDGQRVALVGFSYGGMAATYALQEQVARAFAPKGERFTAHVAYYAPCIARFDDVTTTGAPFAMLYGTGDAIVDPERCARTLADLEAGGSAVELTVLEGAAHQWDARPRAEPWRASRGLAACSFAVDRDGRVRDTRTFLGLDGYVGRTAALALCADDDGYLIQGDPALRARTDVILEGFLERAFAASPS